MSRRLLYLILGTAVLGFGMAGFFSWRYWSNETARRQAEAERIAQQPSVHNLLSNTHKKILFVAETRQPPLYRKLHLLDVVTQESVVVMEGFKKTYSNFLSDTNTWIEIHDSTLRKHQLTTDGLKTEDIVQITHSISTHTPPAISPNGQLISWVSGPAEAQLVLLYDLTTATETVLYGAEVNETFSNLAWSPDSTELAFTAASTNQLITLTPLGAQLYNPVSVPFSQLNSVRWIEPAQIATVLSSTTMNSSPFNPKIVVLSRTGEIVEHHDIFRKIGIPTIVWPPDNSAFMFYDPWTNNFLTYNRFDALQSVIPSNNTDNIQLLGWLSGEDLVTSVPLKNTPTAPPATSATSGTTGGTFTVSAEQWDEYNAVTRAVLQQFAVDFSTYRFNVTNNGIEVVIDFTPKAEKPEKTFIQALLQLLTVLPNLPTVSLRMNIDDQRFLAVSNFTAAQANEVTMRFSNQPLDQLFIITADAPLGAVAPKSEKPQQNYLGDIMYSDSGEYNPTPALAFMRTTLDAEQLLWTNYFSVRYPQSWQTQDLQELASDPYQTGDTIFSTADTVFVSPTVWRGFTVTIRQYAVPTVGLKEWLLVNRGDRDTEDIAFSLHEPLEGKHIVPTNESNDEYVLYANHVVYVIVTERQPSLTDEDRNATQNIVRSFSHHSVFTQN